MIRAATGDDAGAIRRLMESVPGFWQRGWTDRTIVHAIDAARGLALVWDDGGDIVAFVCGHDLGFRAYLSELVVAERARHRGIARELVARLEANLAASGQRVLIADVWRAAEGFYRSLGWEPPDVVLLRRRLGW